MQVDTSAPNPANPADLESLRKRGLLALREGRHQDAIDALQKAIAIDPSQANLFNHLATACQALGRREDAARHLHQVVCLKPESADAFNNWGIALVRLRKPADAAEAFAQAIRLKPDFPAAHNNWGNALTELGQPEAALEQFRQALSLHPAYPDAHNNLGLTLARMGRAAEAVVSLQEARRLNPNYAEAAGNLGSLFRDMGRFEEAAECFRDAIRLRPEHPDPRFQLGITLARQGRHEDAIACFHQCLLFQAEAPEVYHHLGMALAVRERFDEAAGAFRHAVRLKPDSPDYHNNLGNTLLRQRKFDDAVRCFQEAIRVRPDYPLAYSNLGSALLEQGKLDDAIARYQEALRLKPDYVDAQFNLGNALRKARRHAEALASYQRVLELQPEHVGARLNIGVTHSEDGRLDEAVAIFDEIQGKWPQFAEAYNCKGIARLHQRRAADALAEFDQGITLKPDDPEIHLNRALCMLLMGDYERGWQEYEWRWKLKKSAPRPYHQPTWDGSALPEGTVVLWAEQGMGDILQFVRYAPLVKERIGKVLLDCPGPLRGLLASCPGIDGLVGENMPHPAADVQAPLLSLPRILGTRLESIPASVPYLFVDAPLREQWRQRAAGVRGLKVGIIWQGNPLFSGDRYRSVKLEQFRPLAEVPGVRLFSLQKGKGSEQLPGLLGPMKIADWAGQITGDFRDTAAAVLNLDLVISVDTAVAHLAGTLGVPVWVLLPYNGDWRWLEERDDSLWYPSARLFRQTRWGDWEELFTRVAGALGEQSRKPVTRRVPLLLEPAALVEQFVLGEVKQGGNPDARAALEEAGLLDRAELTRHADRLRAALTAIEEAKARMRALACEGEGNLDSQAGELVRRFAKAQQERDDALSELSAWLSGETPAEIGAELIDR